MIKDYMKNMFKLENEITKHKNAISDLENKKLELTKIFKGSEKMNTVNLTLETWEVDDILKLISRKIEKLHAKPKLDEMRLQKIKEYQCILDNISQQIK